MEARPSRRQFFLYTFGAVAGASLLAACKSNPSGTTETTGTSAPSGPPPLVCTDTTGLSSGDVAMRQALNYEDRSANPDKKCSTCVLYVLPASAGACGGCKIVKGPINPEGTCKSWAAKTA